MEPASTSYTEAEERIFEAALHVFSRKGRDGARMQEIADEARINKAMLHYYFRSKDNLYEEVFGYVVRRFIASFAEAVREADTFADTLRLFISSFIDFGKDNLQIIRMMVTENLSGGAEVGRRFAHLSAAHSLFPPRFFLEKVAAAVESGEIRPVDPHQTLLTVVSSCIYFLIMYPIVQVMDPAAARDRDAFIEARKAHLYDLIYHGLAPGAGEG